MQIDHGHQLTWLNLHSLNSSTNQKVYSEMVKHLKQPFCTGWVNKYIIDSYISLLTKQFNIENNEQMFGSLDCDDSTCILQNKIKNKAIFNNRLMIKKNTKHSATYFSTNFVRKPFLVTLVFKYKPYSISNQFSSKRFVISSRNYEKELY